MWHEFDMPKKSLLDAYRFRGFRPQRHIKGVFGDKIAYLITLKRRSKKRCAGVVARSIKASTTDASNKSATCLAANAAFIWNLNFVAWTANGAAK